MNKKRLLVSICVMLGFITFSKTTVSADNVSVYQGPIYNVFFHPLIAYPERAFYSSNENLSYIDKWFVTVNEFKKILPELYKRGFVLVSPKDLFEETKDENGKWIIKYKNVLLPNGKKPLILTLDDYNFYKTMKMHGTIHRFWVDGQGKLVTITDTNNRITIRDDQEIPELLEQFISQHPDFSHNKARGIIDLTGYNGIFGYATHDPLNKSYSQQLIEAQKVVQTLKAMGWEFGSHSYFHKGSDQQTEQAFEASEKRWLKEVGSIVGHTPYYIFPFGDSWDKINPRMAFLKSLGFKYFFGVAQINGTRIEKDKEAVVMERYPLDGQALRGKYHGVELYVNPANVLDAKRLNSK